ncbi:MAG: O-antigen ligase family protein, partial [Sphingobacteriaceae bacterium]|nr:O-antigen ligase family protein [Sphingobacteriaceae bacterium]
GQNLENITNTSGSAGVRLNNYKNALEIISKKPFTGIGIGNWRIESIPYESTQTNDGSVSVHTHNDFLEIAAETGVINGLLYIALFGMLFIMNVKTIFNNHLEKETKLIAVISILLLTAYVIDATFNFPLYRPPMQLLLAFSLAFTILNNAKIDSSLSPIIKKEYRTTYIVASLLVLFSTYMTFKTYEFEYDLRADFSRPENQRQLTPENILKRLPKFPNVYTSSDPFVEFLGVYYYVRQDYVNAIKYLDMGAKINPNLQHFNWYKSNIARQKGNIDSAYYYMETAFKARPRDISYFSGLLYLASAKKDTSKILEIHTAFLKYRNEPQNWISVSDALLTSQYDKSKLLDFIEKGLKSFPKDSTLLERKKLLLQQYAAPSNKKDLDLVRFADRLALSEQYQEAIVNYEKAYKKNPSNAVIRQNIGICYSKIKSYKKAISYLTNCLNLTELNDGKPEYFLGISYFNINDRVNGCKYLKAAAAKNFPNSKELVQQYCK